MSIKIPKSYVTATLLDERHSTEKCQIDARYRYV